MTAARTYIVRLYRRGRKGQPLAGMVEIVPGGHVQHFGTFEELQAILCLPTRSRSRGASGSTNGARSRGQVSKKQP